MKKVSSISALVGGILGVIGSSLMYILGVLIQSVGIKGHCTLASSAIAFICAVTGLVSIIIVNKNPVLCGILLITSAVIGYICGFIFFLPASILFIIAAILAFIPDKASLRGSHM